MNQEEKYPDYVQTILSAFETEDALATIKWISPINTKAFKEELNQLTDDILQGKKNSLYRNSTSASLSF